MIDLVVQVMGDGESFAAETVAKFPENPKGRGQAELFLTIFTAFCRYMNAGGELHTLATHMEGLGQMAADFQIQYPPDWELLSVLQDVQEPTFVLTNEKTGRALVVVEDERTELMDVSDLPELVS